MKKIFLFCILLNSLCNFGQRLDSIPNFDKEYFLVKDGDTLMIQLNTVSILPKHKFKSNIDMRYYFWFKRKVYKAYPYATLASKRLDSLSSRLSKIESKSKRRRYVKRVQSYLENELTERLKKLTRTEGRILLKLIHRQTGKTAFLNIKELRSGWKAFWYNASANIFKLSLRDEYDPEHNNEDYLIEDILQRAYINDELIFQEPKLKKDYITILSNKKGKVDVEEYKRMFAKRKKKKKNKKNQK